MVLGVGDATRRTRRLRWSTASLDRALDGWLMCKAMPSLRRGVGFGVSNLNPAREVPKIGAEAAAAEPTPRPSAYATGARRCSQLQKITGHDPPMTRCRIISRFGIGVITSTLRRRPRRDRGTKVPDYCIDEVLITRWRCRFARP
jgi:hypothetical protein